MSSKKPRKAISLDTILKLFLFFVIILFVLRFMLIEEAKEPNPPSRTSFAKCLNEHGVIMYGNDTCEYCETQKKMFGDDFGEIAYVNCDFNTEQCSENGITVSPVWQVGTKLLVGVQTFDTLAQETGCKPPK